MMMLDVRVGMVVVAMRRWVLGIHQWTPSGRTCASESQKRETLLGLQRRREFGLWDMLRVRSRMKRRMGGKLLIVDVGIVMETVMVWKDE